MSRHICPQRGVSQQLDSSLFTPGSTDNTDIRPKDTSPHLTPVPSIPRRDKGGKVETQCQYYDRGVVVMFSVPAVFRLSETRLRMSQSDAKL